MTGSKYKIKLTAEEMNLIKQSIEATAYAGKISEAVTKIKKKMTPPQPKAPVHVLSEGEK